MSWQLAWAIRTAEGVQVAQRGLKALGKEPSADRCMLLAMTGANLSLGGDYTGGQGPIAQAVEMAEGLGDQRLLGQVLTYKTAHLAFFMQARDALDTGLRAADLLRSEGDDWGLANVLWYPQLFLLLSGRLDEAAELGKELVHALATVLAILNAIGATVLFGSGVSFWIGTAMLVVLLGVGLVRFGTEKV